MKIFLSAMSLSFLLFSNLSMAMGQRAQVYERSSEAGIWDHGSEFYLRLDLSEIAGLKNQTFVWAGFTAESSERTDQFKGELVTNDFSPEERRFPARAKLLQSTAMGRYFLIEVLDDKGEIIKEIFVKGPAFAQDRR